MINTKTKGVKNMTSKNSKCICYVLVVIAVCFISTIISLYIKITPFEEFCKLADIFVSALTGFGTICLAYVANRQNKKLMEIENKSSEIAMSSCVVMEEYDGENETPLSNECKSKYDDSGKYLYLKLYNGGEAVLKKIDIDFDGKQFVSHLSLAKGRLKSVRLPVPDNFDVSTTVYITYTSCYDVHTNATFKLKKYDDSKYIHKYYHYEGLKERKK